MASLKLENQIMSIESFKTRVIATMNRTLPTPRSRMIAVLVALAVATLAIDEKIVQSILVPVFLAVCLISLIKYIVSRKRPQKRHVIRSIVGGARRLRKTFAVGRDVELLHLTVLLLCFVLLIISQFQRSPVLPISAPWVWCTCSLFVLAGAVDAARVVIAMTKFTWTRLTVKAFYAGAAAFSVWAGDVVAKKLVAQATGFAPEHFVATERLIHWVATPLIGLSVIVGALSMLSLATYAIIMFGSMLTQQMQRLVSLVFPLTQPRKKASIAYRLRYGKNQMKGTSTRLLLWEDAVVMMRPLAVFAAGATILWGVGQLQDMPMTKLGPIVRELVVQIEFNEGQKCGTTLVTEPINHLENGAIAVAIKVEGDWKLESDICEAVKREPKRL